MKTDLEFERLYYAAQDAFTKRRLEESERLYLKLLERSPRGFADVFNNLGLIYSEKGLLERATQYFKKALAINPKYTEASLNLAVTYNELQNFEEAEKVFRQAAKVIDSEPTSIDPFIQGKLANEHAKLGDSYYKLGLYDQALVQYRMAQELRPNFADILTKIGVTLTDKGDLDPAIEIFGKAKETNPKFEKAYIYLGIAYYKKGQRDLAIVEWKAAQKINPSDRAIEAYLTLSGKS